MDIELLSKIGEKLGQAIGNAAHQYGPPVWQMVLSIKRVDSLGHLIPSLVVLGIFPFILIKLYRFFKSNAADCCPGRPFIYCGFSAGYGLVLFVSTVILIPFLVQVLNIWNWVGVFDPQVAIAKDIMDKILRGGN